MHDREIYMGGSPKIVMSEDSDQGSNDEQSAGADAFSGERADLAGSAVRANSGRNEVVNDSGRVEKSGEKEPRDIISPSAEDISISEAVDPDAPSNQVSDGGSDGSDE
ncbi:hypothetical protein [Halocatena halophila]|uniref:hypothetical protein n=1 Tax=Halocatena halophila TaxID=2814576 RepID=UPI002ED482BB